MGNYEKYKGKNCLKIMLQVKNLNNQIEEIWPKNGPPSQEVQKYIKKYSKEKIVIKCGGKVLLDKKLLNLLIEDIVILKKLGLTPLIVHGGGPRIKPGTGKGNAYCARSYGDMKSHGKDCSGKDRGTPLCLSRQKWKCSGKYSRKGK